MNRIQNFSPKATVSAFPLHERIRFAIQAPVDSPAARSLLMLLATHAHAATLACWPSACTLVKESRFSRSAVFRGLDELEKAGLIARRTPLETGRSTTTYILRLAATAGNPPAHPPVPTRHSPQCLPDTQNSSTMNRDLKTPLERPADQEQEPPAPSREGEEEGSALRPFPVSREDLGAYLASQFPLLLPESGKIIERYIADRIRRRNCARQGYSLSPLNFGADFSRFLLAWSDNGAGKPATTKSGAPRGRRDLAARKATFEGNAQLQARFAALEASQGSREDFLAKLNS